MIILGSIDPNASIHQDSTNFSCIGFLEKAFGREILQRVAFRSDNALAVDRSAKASIETKQLKQLIQQNTATMHTEAVVVRT